MAIDHKILIYSQQTSPRLEYVLKLICNDLWKIQWKLTHDFNQFQASSVGVINYSHRHSKMGIQIKPHALLFEKGVENQNTTISTQNKLPVFFGNDYFAMIFYMVSRYEEYLPFKADKHHRFPASQSLAFKNDFLDQPIVHLWANHLKQQILEHFPFLKFGNRAFKIQPTYDIDMAWAIKNKGWKRQTGGLVKSILGNTFKNRLKVLSGKLKDPFDTFDYLDQVNECHLAKAKYFIQIGDFGTFDKNIAHNHPDFIVLIKKLSQKYHIGIHPSYQSNGNLNILSKEKQRLEKIIEKPITRSRQHYLKLNFPHTYHHLLNVGINEDYSMGFQDAIGFRAGISIPYYWYDLSLEKETILKIFPFQIMDVTMKQYLGWSVENAIQNVKVIQNRIASIGGDLTYLWHNSSFYTIEGWEDWNLVLESITTAQ